MRSIRHHQTRAVCVAGALAALLLVSGTSAADADARKRPAGANGRADVIKVQGYTKWGNLD